MSERSTPSSYDRLIADIDSAGFVAVLYPPATADARVVCAVKRDHHGSLAGTSFWVMQKSGHWYVGTWTELIWDLGCVDITEFCCAFLSMCRAKTQYYPPAQLLAKYNAQEVAREDYRTLFVDRHVSYVLQLLWRCWQLTVGVRGADYVPDSARDLVAMAIKTSRDSGLSSGDFAAAADLPKGYTVEFEMRGHEWDAFARSADDARVFWIASDGDGEVRVEGVE